ncbi:hypothetical protein [Dyadobacter sandarakinus]|uniref:Uncharacterized protein n=1 Tax=Dyadobacter sandarakinus TaxID=2747268 RepID=A0ABX7I734_9BACT|nr:hypothetical protein [Dyadobacter sandarakinus]QRR01600.1 hypothetical protein HWI92_12130 [Dyadobacter sandarakinus]
MKQIEEKLDSIEEVLTILIKKVSGLENLHYEKKEVKASSDPVLAEIRDSVSKMPSGHLMLSEIYRLRKSIDEIFGDLVHKSAVSMNWRSGGLLLAASVLLIMATCGVIALKFISNENEQLKHMSIKYTSAQELEPELFTWLDSLYLQKRYWPVDSLRLMRRPMHKRSNPNISTDKKKGRPIRRMRQLCKSAIGAGS